MPQSLNKAFTRSEKILLALMAALQFAHIVDFMIMMPLGPQLTRIFSIGPTEFGLLVSSYTLSAGISGFAASFFIDRFDRKSGLLFFQVGFIVGTLACAIAPTFSLLLISRSVAGAFGGVLGSLVLSVVSDAIPYQRRGTAMGIVMGSFAVASVVGVPFSLYLANSLSWHAPFFFLGGLSILVALLILLLMPRMREHLRERDRPQRAFEALTHIASNSNQLSALAFMFCLVLGQFSVIPLLSLSYVTNGGMLEADLPLIYLFGGLCTIFASPGIGRLSDLFGKKRVFQTSVLISLIPIYFITNLEASPLWLILTLSCFFFVMMSGRMVPAMAMISATATPAYRGSFMSISSSVQQLSAALASFVSGLIVLTNSSGQLVRFDVVGYFAIGFSLLALMMSNRLRADEHSLQSQLEDR